MLIQLHILHNLCKEIYLEMEAIYFRVMLVSSEKPINPFLFVFAVFFCTKIWWLSKDHRKHSGTKHPRTMVISSETRQIVNRKKRKEKCNEGFLKRKSKVHYNALFFSVPNTPGYLFQDRVNGWNEWYILDFFLCFSFLSRGRINSMSFRIFPRELYLSGLGSNIQEVHILWVNLNEFWVKFYYVASYSIILANLLSLRGSFIGVNPLEFPWNSMDCVIWECFL